MTAAKSDGMGLLRDDDSDDVRWALQTASVQMTRGGAPDAIVWIERAADAAAEAGNDWRAAELRAHARTLGESTRPAMASIPVEVEEVELDELLDNSSRRPSAAAPGAARGNPTPWAPQSARPSNPAPSAGRLSMPPPLPAQNPFTQNPSAQNSFVQSPFAQNSANHGALAAPSYAPPPAYSGNGGRRSSSLPPALPGSLAGVNAGISPIPAGVAFRPGSLAQRTAIAFPAAGRVQQPSAPSLTRDLRASLPPPLPPGAFVSAANQRGEFDYGASRAPLGSSPDLEVNEVDLDEAGIDLTSLGPGSLRGFSERPWNPRAHGAEGVIADLETAFSRRSSGPPSQDLSHLYAEEEVLEDGSEDRLSDLTLDEVDFASSRGTRESGPPSMRGSQLPPVNLSEPPDFAGSSHRGREQSVTANSAPAWITPKGGASDSDAPVRQSFAPAPGADVAESDSVPPPSRLPPASVPPPSGGRAFPSAPPPSAAGGRSRPPQAPVRGNRSSQPAPASTRAAQGNSKSKPPVLVRKSSGPPSAGQPQSSPPSASDRLTSKPAAPPSSSVLGFARTLTGGTGIHDSAAPASRNSFAAGPAESLPPMSISSLPTLTPKAASKPTLAAATGTAGASASTKVDGVDLGEARGFEDLPAAVQMKLAACAKLETLAEGEEVAFFGAAVVTFGAVDILPAISDEAGAAGHLGDVVFTIGTLAEAMPLRVVAKLEGTRVAVWDRVTLNEAIAECPWVHDELHQIADRFLACCGATLGALGERLDDSLRGAVYSRFDVGSYEAGEELVSVGDVVPKLFVVGAGRLELVDSAGQVVGELSPGDFLFPASILSGGRAPQTARAGAGGALLLQTSRVAAHELMMSVPPLLEILAS